MASKSCHQDCRDHPWERSLLFWKCVLLFASMAHTGLLTRPKFMPEQALAPQSARPPVAFWQHGITALLVLGFIAAGWLRLNDCDLFNPDSPRYLIYAQGLADTG